MEKIETARVVNNEVEIRDVRGGEKILSKLSPRSTNPIMEIGGNGTQGDEDKNEIMFSPNSLTHKEILVDEDCQDFITQESLISSKYESDIVNVQHPQYSYGGDPHQKREKIDLTHSPKVMTSWEYYQYKNHGEKVGNNEKTYFQSPTGTPQPHYFDENGNDITNLDVEFLKIGESQLANKNQKLITKTTSQLNNLIVKDVKITANAKSSKIQVCDYPDSIPGDQFNEGAKSCLLESMEAPDGIQIMKSLSNCSSPCRVEDGYDTVEVDQEEEEKMSDLSSIPLRQTSLRNRESKTSESIHLDDIQVRPESVHKMLRLQKELFKEPSKYKLNLNGYGSFDLVELDYKDMEKYIKYQVFNHVKREERERSLSQKKIQEKNVAVSSYDSCSEVQVDELNSMSSSLGEFISKGKVCDRIRACLKFNWFFFWKSKSTVASGTEEKKRNHELAPETATSSGSSTVVSSSCKRRKELQCFIEGRTVSCTGTSESEENCGDEHSSQWTTTVTTSNVLETCNNDSFQQQNLTNSQSTFHHSITINSTTLQEIF